MHLFKEYSPKFNIKLVVLHIAIWGALLGLPYLFNASHKYTIGSNIFGQNFFTVTNMLHVVLFYFNAHWLYPRFFTKGRRGQYIFLILLVIGLFFYIKIVFIQIGVFPFSMKPSLFPILFFPTVLFVLISIVYRLIIDKIHFENEKMHMELKFLRSQVNPHFLFNVLNNMVSMARHKSDQLESSLIKLSGLMRYMLYESGDPKVLLTKEIEYLKNYIELQRIRFSDDVPIRTNFAEVNHVHQIEPMLLISFIENAFKHGVGLIDDPLIDISLSVDDDILFFEVSNTFNDQNNQKDPGSGIGLENVKKRLELLYPNQHHIEISRTDNVFNVHLKLALK